MISVHYYDINGKHTLLNDNNKPMLFDNKEEAVVYLMTEQCDDEFIQECCFEEFNGDADEIYTKSEII